MKRKIWIFNLALLLLICILLGCSILRRSGVHEINTDILTPEIEIPNGSEQTDEQSDEVDDAAGSGTEENGAGASGESAGSKSKSYNDNIDSSDNEESNGSEGSDRGDIVTPELEPEA